MGAEIKAISERLDFQKQICLDALKEYAASHPAELAPFENEKIEMLLNRMFMAEKEFLYDNPDDYVEIYGDE